MIKIKERKIYKGVFTKKNMVKGKRGAEESNIIVFIILALVVAGLVIFFSWNFFEKGGAILVATDPVVQSALKFCEAEKNMMNENSWCTTIKYVPYAKQKQYVTCDYLNSMTGKTIEDVPSCNNAEVDKVLEDYCLGLGKNPGSLKEYINGKLCEKDKNGVLIFNKKETFDQVEQEKIKELEDCVSSEPKTGAAYCKCSITINGEIRYGECKLKEGQRVNCNPSATILKSACNYTNIPKLDAP